MSEVIPLFPGTFMDGFPVIEGFATHSDFIALDLGEEKKERESAILYIAELYQVFQCLAS